ncbi:MAG TPA: hypothetical protein VIR63_02210 [Pontiella sp.]
MKLFVKIFAVLTVASVIAGCATDSIYVPRLPSEVDAKLLDYFEQPDNKVFIVAIDPGGDYAYAYDYGKATIKEAAEVAVEKCDASREATGVVGQPYIYAMNNKVVYKEMIERAHKARQKAIEAEKEVQIDAAGVEDIEQAAAEVDAKALVEVAEEM